MINIDKIRQNVGNAIRSLYQLILMVNEQTYECYVIDYNCELRNLSDEMHSFDGFCDDLYINIHPEDREGFVRFTDPDYFPGELARKVYTSYECRIRQADSRYYWSEITFCNATKEDSAQGHDYLFMLRDIHEWKMRKLREEAEHRALIKKLEDEYAALYEESMHDAQTGCYNRKGLKYHSDIVLEEARTSGKYLFVCVADLNGLKYLNDTYGHCEGDKAIDAVCKALSKAAPKGAVIVRTGGDEFLLIGALDKQSKEPMEMGAKIDAELEAYNREQSSSHLVGASYGWVFEPIKEHMVSLDEYIEKADAKMYEMKVQRDKYRRDLL
ncbi:GGDEF domain-containing protein [Eubacterium oxidoreducens]|uniref:Diguanylate cyclase (GGDEF) domain-containing protein n=1 Tax=Eubacterium oxidoreducens TaxID=1732 RepID=A0A1G6AWA6_EUBOX|nr:GGDEF domain-containing protein [Eubacterium oxidoreducens]SDB12533.1 diguanylate cyclase (GGDEF) domain-containing protein [Eubacterium oxidoreducens]